MLKRHLPSILIPALVALHGCASVLHRAEIGRVSQLAGEWDLSSILSRYGAFQISVAFGKKIESDGPSRIIFKDSVQAPSGSMFPSNEAVLLDLRFDTSQSKYLFNFAIGSRRINDLPLVFEEDKGLKGIGEMQVGDSKLSVEVEILMRQDGSKWEILAPDKSQPVEKKKDKPLESYSFDFTKPKLKGADAEKKKHP